MGGKKFEIFGLPKVGLEVGCLDLLRNRKDRDEVEGWDGGKRRKNTFSSKFEKDLEEQECFVMFKGAGGSRSGSG